MTQTTINPISQEFIKEADNQLNAIKAMNFNDLLKILTTLYKIEDNLKCALYTGDNNAYYKLIQLYDFKFENYPSPDNLDALEKESRDTIVLAGRKLGVKECFKTELIFNSQKPTEKNISSLIKSVQTIQKHFKNTTLANNLETKQKIIELYYQMLEAISEKQHFKSIKEITGVVLNCTHDTNLDCIDDNYIINNEVVPIGNIKYNPVYYGG